MNTEPIRTFSVGGMDCAGCAREVEKGVAQLPGVESVSVDFATATMRLSGDVSFERLQNRVQALGKSLNAPETEQQRTPDSPGSSSSAPSHSIAAFWRYLASRQETQFALAGGGILVMTLALSLMGLSSSYTDGLYTLGMGITLLPILKSGINSLRINRTFNINLLMCIAAVGAILIGEYLESATVIFLFAIGEALEGFTADRARDSIRSLMALKPIRAVRVGSEAGEEEEVHVNHLNIGDLLLVKPGENIPMDGEVVRGTSGVNQAPITGESVPITKSTGDTVYAGSVNGEGVLLMRVTHLVADNTLSRIIRLVEEAQSVRAPSQRVMDRFAQVYTPAVTLLAVLVALVPPLLFNAPLYDTPTEHGWLYRALSMLVIACPCALVISTPVTVMSAIAAAARRGVLIKGGAYLEAAGQVRVIAFDKTGTLTQGHPAVIAYRAAACQTGLTCDLCDDVLALASAVERRTTHPLAQAVLQTAEAHHVSHLYTPAEAVELLAGRGVRGIVNGKMVTVGSHALFDQEFPHPPDFCTLVRTAEANGQTTMLVAEETEVRGFLALADETRSDSTAVVRALNQMDVVTVMLTGDNAPVARAVAAEVGVREVQANLLPQDKVTAVEALRRTYGKVMIVGDGINDAPALAAADIGVAMGGAGSPQALETAHIALLADDLAQLPYTVRLSQFVRQLIRQNIALSFGVKFVFLCLAFLGLTSLWVAIFADVGMSLLVTLNGMRPLRFEPRFQTINSGDSAAATSIPST